MARCPTCHRRLPPATHCPIDGAVAPEEAAPPSSPPPALGGFEVKRLLGAGGFGAVWEALAADGKTVAIKVGHGSDADSVRRLGREAETMGQVGPPQAPAMYGHGTLADGRPYLVMELLVGHLLADEIAPWVRPPALGVAQALGEALLESAAAVSAAGLIHRDLKPENVFVVREADRVTAKLMDFGLAASVTEAERQPDAAGAGTPEYMSPEQIGGKVLDLRSDVYTLGVMLFELYTLRLPFTGDRRELEYGHLSLRPPRPSRFVPVPSAIEEVILRCLNKDPAARFADALAMHVAFREANAVAPPADSTEISVTSAPATKKTAVRAGEKQKVALVFAQSDRFSTADVQAALQPFGGQLAHVGTGQGACAFTHRAGDTPGPRALAAAQALLAKGLAQRLIIDVASVTVKPRPDGPARLIGAVFSQAARYPTTSDPEGILIAAAARALLPRSAGAAAPGRPEHFLVVEEVDDDRTRTTMQDAQAALVGRDSQLRALIDEAMRAVSDRRPRVASVLADPGLGKTRVAAELGLLLRIKVPQARVIELRAREPLGNDTEETLAELLRRTLELPAVPPADGGRALLAELLGARAHDSYAAVALVLGWIGSDHPAVQALRAAPGVLRANAARAGMEALRRLASENPVLVVLDDAHWADDALLDALEQTTVSELPFWVVAFGRPGFAESRPSWGRRAAHVEAVPLGPLDPASAATLCRQLLQPATSVPETVITRLVDRTQGVPLLVCDLVRGLRREGLVREQAGGVWYVATEVLDKMPDSPLVEWLSERELGELPAELAAHARLVSLLSPEVTASEVEGVIGAMSGELAETFPMDTAVAMDRLRQARILTQHRSGRFAFRTGVMREAVASTVPDARAADIHRSALGYYRAAPLPDAIRLPRLAWHAARAGERHAAAATYLVVAETARERHNYLEADLDYSRALDQIDPGEEEAQLRAYKGRGTMRYRLGRHDGSLADLAKARELAVKSGNTLVEADVLLDESMALDWLYEWARSRELAERARELVAAHPQPVLEARVLLAVGRSYQRFNRDREAAELLRAAAKASKELGDDGYEVRVISDLMLGFLLPFLGLLDEAQERLDRTVALCEEKGDELHLGAVWNNRSCLWIARNDRARFMEDNGKLLAYARRMGNVGLERNGNINSAYFLYWRAEFEAAIPFVRRAIETDERYFHHGGFRPDGAVLLARILWGAGREEESRKLVEDVRAHQARARAAGQNDLLLQPNDEMLLDMITLVLARGTAAQWEPLMERARAVAQGQELIEVLEVAGVAAQARGEGALARQWWQEALQAGERIPNVMADRIRQRLTASA